MNMYKVKSETNSNNNFVSRIFKLSEQIEDR